MTIQEKIIQDIQACDKLLIGIGEEWKSGSVADIMALYGKLGRLAEGKDYFIITTVTDGKISDTELTLLDPARIVAPCGNITWRQCSESCTKDIWEQGEIPDDICPHCGAPLTGNTIEAKTYIEEGYLPKWNAYTRWLAGTLNRRLTVIELGVGFGTPTVIRWPFEKTVNVNKKAHLYRIHGKFAQLSEEIRDKADSVGENSVEFFMNL